MVINYLWPIINGEPKKRLTSMNTTFKERLKALRKKKALTQDELAKLLHPRVSKVAISQWETGVTEPKMTNLKALADLFDVGIEWLSTGRLIDQDSVAHKLEHVAVPCVDLDPNKDWVDNYIKIDLKLLGNNTERLAWFEIQGDCMSPFLNDSAIVIIDTKEQRIKDGDLYLIVCDNYSRVKQLAQSLTGVVVKSFSAEYADENYSSQTFDKNFKIKGKVILQISKI